jgi:hypothetical protein
LAFKAKKRNSLLKSLRAWPRNDDNREPVFIEENMDDWPS